MTRSSRCLALAVTLTCATGARLLAQNTDTGPLIAFPIAMMVEDATPSLALGGPMSRQEVYYKQSGFGCVDGAAPAAVTGPWTTGPDFSFAAVFQSSVPIEVDAMSIGQDILDVDPTGQFVVPTGAWAALLFSVRQESGLTGTFGLVHDELVNTASGGAGADVFTFVPCSSAMCEPRFIGSTGRALDGWEMGISLGATPAQTGQIAAIDPVIPLYSLDPDVLAFSRAGALADGALDPQPTMYFSLSAGTVSLVPASWFGGTTPSGATILRTRWDTATTTWSTPTPLYTHLQLGLPSSADIDALAYNEDSDRLVISLTRSTTPAGLTQLIYVETPTYTGSGRLFRLHDLSHACLDGPGTPIANEIGTGNGDIVGTCSVDPITASPQTPPPCDFLYNFIWSSPASDGPGSLQNLNFDQQLQSVFGSAPAVLEGAAYRATGTSGPVYRAHLTGLGPSTGANGTAWLVLDWGTGTAPSPCVLPGTTYNAAAPRQSWVATTWTSNTIWNSAGDPVTLTLDMFGLSVGLGTASACVHVDAFWLAVKGNSTGYSQVFRLYL